MEENQDGANVTIHTPDKVSDAVDLHKEHSTQQNIPNNGGEIQAEKDGESGWSYHNSVTNPEYIDKRIERNGTIMDDRYGE